MQELSGKRTISQRYSGKQQRGCTDEATEYPGIFQVRHDRAQDKNIFFLRFFAFSALFVINPHCSAISNHSTLQEREFIKVVYLEDSHVIIGAQLLCARATDMVSEFAVAIQKRLTLEDMAGIIRPHPSFSEMITDSVTL